MSRGSGRSVGAGSAIRAIPPGRNGAASPPPKTRISSSRTTPVSRRLLALHAITGVYPGRVGIENFTRLRGQARPLPISESSETERSSHAISRQPGLAHDLGGLPPGQSAQPEHLGQTILGMSHPESQPSVSVRQRLNVGDTPSVSQHRDRRPKPNDLDPPRLRGKRTSSSLNRTRSLGAQPNQTSQNRQDRKPLPGVETPKRPGPSAPSAPPKPSAVPPLPSHRIPLNASVAPRRTAGRDNKPIIVDRLGGR